MSETKLKTPKTGKLRVAAYIRVSTDSSDQENSYETQDLYFSKLLSRHEDWICAGIYSDYGLSGTDGRHRTGFNRILRHCMEGKIDRIVCKSISRFARNTFDFMNALRVLRDCGVTILFEKEALDTLDPTSDFIITTLGAIAQEESRSISGNVRWGMQKRFPRGDVRNQNLYGYRYSGETVVTPSGYQYRAVEVVEQEARVVRRIFQAVADGESYTDIARALNCEHIPAPISLYTQKRKKCSEKGQLNSFIEEGWTGRHIAQMILHERYVGDVLIQKTYTADLLTHEVRKNRGEVEQYLVQDHHPAIVDRKLYQEVQEVRQMNQHQYGGKKSRKKHAFSGRLICGDCGRFYNIRNTKANPIWFCPSTVRNNGRVLCRSRKVYEVQIIRMVRKAVLERFRLVALPMGHVKVSDIMRAELGNSPDREAYWTKGTGGFLTEEAGSFVPQMLVRLENVQRLDYIERDRAFLKRQLTALQTGNESLRKRIRQLQTQKDSLEARKYVLGEESIREEEIRFKANQIEMNLANLAHQEEEEAGLALRLEHLENYWEELEADFECRKAVIGWMKTLPEGQEGTLQFLKGLTDEYARAFILSVKIHSPYACTVHWFDDTRTEIKMYTDVEDFRRTASYFDGRAMRDGGNWERAL